jgi:hypothetical protein
MGINSVTVEEANGNQTVEIRLASLATAIVRWITGNPEIDEQVKSSDGARLFSAISHSHH